MVEWKALPILAATILDSVDHLPTALVTLLDKTVLLRQEDHPRMKALVIEVDQEVAITRQTPTIVILVLQGIHHAPMATLQEAVLGLLEARIAAGRPIVVIPVVQVGAAMAIVILDHPQVAAIEVHLEVVLEVRQVVAQEVRLEAVQKVAAQEVEETNAKFTSYEL